MNILLGVGVLAATVMLFCWTYGAHRRPQRAAWADWPGCSMLACVGFTILGPIGVGFVIKGLLNPLADLAQVDLVSALACLAIVAVSALASPVLIRPALRGKHAPARADNLNAAPAVVEMPRAA